MRAWDSPEVMGDGVRDGVRDGVKDEMRARSHRGWNERDQLTNGLGNPLGME